MQTRSQNKEDPCPYYEQRWAAEDAKLTLSNPSYMFRAVKGFTNFEQRQFAIIDEAHDMEGFIHDLLEVRLVKRNGSGYLELLISFQCTCLRRIEVGNR